MHATQSKKEPADIGSYIKPILIGTAAGTIACIVLLLLASVIVAVGNVPHGVVSPIAIVIAALSALCGGFFASRAAGARGMAVGAAAGLVLFLLIFLAGIAFMKQPVTLIMVIKLALMVIFGGGGGVFGINTRRR